MGRASREPEILAAALACFAERGYDATRVKHIAERAGVSEAALYRHHASKEAVALALFATHMRRYSDVLREIADDRSSTVGERVKGLARSSLDLRRADPVAHAFVLGHTGRFMSALPAGFPYPIRIIEGLVREGQADATVRPGPVRVLAALALGCMSHPAIVAQHAAPGTIDLTDPGTVDVVADGAWAAIAA
ncbi:MAG TPA: helix-turn-helix domain-containing protein [Baekduia sp.]|uniref:TetR/AcrR family transcriptional regulator n=1 Tax=Baekduia sp. TaxID=2600305 RepID=UPI002CF92074|nr:helix-turn-helix domain-containing protein [Baekduia sp.]HMJ37202.1 helix-turn-helix domain-containing protein [Baekduia sp.]